MDTAPVDPLFVALRDSGQFTADQLATVARAFAEVGGVPATLADRLNAAGVLTRYQFKKVQVGRPGDLLFGQYLLLDKIGEGGMGKVYRAVQLRMHRMVALKVVRPQLMANKTVVKRYEREAEAAARLDHPNIVKLYDAELADNRYFLAMEYVEGLDLARLVKQFGPLPYQEACEYVRQAALGLHHAHGIGLIHRDIKPSNLLVYGERALPGTNGKAKLKILDMGLVRSILEEDANQVDLTRDGTVVGTPDYMSPEQAKNSSQVTAKADIYSLGCTLYYLLTGKPPFPEGTPVEKLIKHQLDPFPDVRKLVPSVPAGVAKLIADMTAKKTADRFAGADMVAVTAAVFSPDGGGVDLFSMPSSAAPSGPKSGRFEQVDFTPSAVAAAPAAAPRVAAFATVVVAEATVLSPTPPATRTGKSGPATVRTAKPKAAIPLPEAAEAISSESMPNAESRKSTRVAAGATPTRVRKPSKPAKPVRKFPTKLVAAAVVFAVAAVVAVLLVFHKPEPPPQMPPEPKKPDEQPKPPSKEVGYRAVEDLLPDNAVGVVIAHPKAYFDRYAYEGKPLSRQALTYDRLTKRFHFDLRKMERLEFAFVGGGKGFAVAGEGAFLKADWIADLEKYPKSLKVTKDTGGAKRLSFLLPRQPFNPTRERLSEVEGAVLPGPPPVYLLAEPADLLTRLVRRNNGRPSDTGPATGVNPALLKSALASAAKAPLLSLHVAGEFALPGKTETLASEGVSALAVEARMDKKFTFEVSVTGDKAKDLAVFLGTALPKWLTDTNADLAPVAKLLAAAEPVEASVGGQVRSTVTITVEWDAVQAMLERLLPPIPPNEK